MTASDVLRQAEQALVSMDADAMVSLYAGDFLFEDTASGDRIADREELRSYFDRLFSMPDVSFSDVSFFSLGDRGAGQWTWGGISVQSGGVYSVRGASLFKLEGNGSKKKSFSMIPERLYLEKNSHSNSLEWKAFSRSLESVTKGRR